MSKKKKAKPITTRKKRTRRQNKKAETQRDHWKESEEGPVMRESVFVEERARIQAGKPLRGQLKGYA